MASARWRECCPGLRPSRIYRSPHLLSGRYTHTHEGPASITIPCSCPLGHGDRIRAWRSRPGDDLIPMFLSVASCQPSALRDGQGGTLLPRPPRHAGPQTVLAATPPPTQKLCGLRGQGAMGANLATTVIDDAAAGRCDVLSVAILCGRFLRHADASPVQRLCVLTGGSRARRMCALN
jgi:hypothetical protein